MTKIGTVYERLKSGTVRKFRSKKARNNWARVAGAVTHGYKIPKHRKGR